MARRGSTDKATTAERAIEHDGDEMEAAARTQAMPSVMLSGEQFQQLLDTLGKHASGGDGSEGLKATIAALTLQSQTQKTYAEEFARQVRRSNQFHPDVSVFRFDPRCQHCTSNTEHIGANGESLGLAHPRVPLRHEVFFCYNRVRVDDLTPVEVELYNAFEETKEARGGKWRATVRKEGGKSQLHIEVPYRGLDAMSELPPLTVILSELLYGDTVVDPTMAIAHQRAMQKQIEMLMAQVAALTKAAEPATVPA